jgi:glycosyltransferase involved in cell wall biosynthesis
MLGTKERVEILQKPWKLPILISNLFICWLKLIKKSRRLPKTDVVMVGYLGQFDIHLAKLLYRKRIIGLDYMISGSETAKDRKSSSGIKDIILRAIDNAALKASDLIVVDTEERIETLPNKFQHKAIAVIVGAPDVWFKEAKKPTKIKDTDTVKVIYVGAYTPLHGAPTIGEAISLLNVPIKILMIGNGQDYEETRSKASGRKETTKVEWLTNNDFAETMKTVADCDINLGIFSAGKKALNVVPNKVYQGASVGCAGITSDTPVQRRIMGDACLYVPPEDPTALANAITRLATSKELLYKQKLAAYNLAQTNFKGSQIVEKLVISLQNMLKSYDQS